MLRPSSGEPPEVADLKEQFSALLGVDLTGVRVRLGAGGQAEGETWQGEVRLSVGEQALRTAEGQRLLAHELIHAAQELRPADDEEACEIEADELAARVVAGRPGTVAQGAPGVPLYRNLLSAARQRSAIQYNRRCGYGQATIRRIQREVGADDDGIIGPHTVEMVARWQSRHGLDVDGKVGPQTRAAMLGPGGESDHEPGPNPGGPPPSGSLTAHFSLAEFRSKDGAPTPASVVPRLQHLAQNLEALREALGGASISINSGYRSSSHNAGVGGATNSQHLYGRAADFTVAGRSPWEVKQKIEQLIAQGKMDQGGVGLYSTFVHYDTRGYRARW